MTTAPARRSVFDAALPTVAYHGVRCPDQAHEIIAAARQQAPIAMGPFGPELLTYDLVRLALRDSRFAMPQANGLAMQGITAGPLWDKVSALIVGLDGAEHRRLRRLVSRAFTPRAAERMRTACRDIMTELIDQHVDAGHCDVVADIAKPYPVPIICATIGVPRDDWDLFSHWLRGIAKAFGPTPTAHTAAILQAWQHLDTYLEDLIERRCRTLTDDLISELIRAEDDGDQLSRREILDLIAVLLVAGTDTTRNQLAAAVQVLSDHPEQWALLARRPELAAQAVEEVMRHSPASFSAIRVTVEDADFNGIVVTAGTCLVVNAAAANRDPARYDEPERFDVTRHNSAAMLTFGGGAHHCLGAHLARVELAEALVVMTRRMTHIRRTGPAPWRPIVGIAGPQTLPVEFQTQANAAR
ncbi:cytochrome P450 279A2 Cyp279A2 [Mycobacterium lentiflavum]|uniref:Cytochrome P450 279A2 Cyp279A2 n=1 Tax=Mycobacterium lentiflavum TaxID=141349 RepID=A0A0E4CQZ3_MYCLN|nr:cytochrome P450 [Mycobacterium lentiflavum]CQD22896.1 cytochrome P450 279A2 Cyp279A2 [Mycobacterium lentiflavum]